MLLVLGLYLLASATNVDETIAVLLVTGTAVFLLAFGSFVVSRMGHASISVSCFLASVAAEVIGGIWFNNINSPVEAYVFAFMGLVQVLPFIVCVAGVVWLSIARKRAASVLAEAEALQVRDASVRMCVSVCRSAGASGNV